MKAKPSDWLRLLFSMLGYAFATIAIAMFMNLTGDCAPDVTDCGETARKLSFVVLGLGALWLGYLAFEFARQHRD